MRTSGHTEALAVEATTPPPKLLYTLPEVTERTGLSRSFIYELIASGELEAVKAGSRRLIIPASLDAYITRLRGQ